MTDKPQPREWVINLEERIVLNTPPKGYYSEPCDSVFVVEKSAYDALAAQLATCQKQLENMPSADEVKIALDTIMGLCGFAANHNCWTTPVPALIKTLNWLRALADMRKGEGK